MKDVFKFTVIMFVIPAGLFLYTLFNGYPPVYCLPVVLGASFIIMLL